LFNGSWLLRTDFTIRIKPGSIIIKSSNGAES
jgi:hypothetical protein